MVDEEETVKREMFQSDSSDIDCYCNCPASGDSLIVPTLLLKDTTRVLALLTGKKQAIAVYTHTHTHTHTHTILLLQYYSYSINALLLTTTTQ